MLHGKLAHGSGSDRLISAAFCAVIKHHQHGPGFSRWQYCALRNIGTYVLRTTAGLNWTAEDTQERSPEERTVAWSDGQC